LIQSTEKSIIRLNQELQNGQKALSEGLIVSEDIDKKFQQDVSFVNLLLIERRSVSAYFVLIALTDGRNRPERYSAISRNSKYYRTI